MNKEIISYRLLVVEDNPGDYVLLEQYLQLSGKSTKIDPLTPALFKAKFVWRMGVKAPGFSTQGIEL